MSQRQRYIPLCVIFVSHLFACNSAYAFKFEPGVGVALESTDNARLTPENQVDDLIAVTYLGAGLSEDAGPLTYDAVTSFNKQNFTKDSFADQRYLYLNAGANWVMIEERFIWTMSDYFSQLPVNSVGSNTPNNLQDTNVFTLSADIRLPVSARQSFSIVPTYRQFYYEKLLNDNNQYSLAGSWLYQMFRLSNVSLNANVRNIEYTEKNVLGQSIIGSTFTTASLYLNRKQQRSNYAINLGLTNVKRDNGEETTGFAGFLSWDTEVSSRSRFSSLISTNLTDASSVAVGLTDDSGVNNGVQITSDVIRNSVINLSYARLDELLNTSLSMRVSKITYSESPLDRIIRDFNFNVSHPVTQLLSSGAYIRYNRIKQIESPRLDEWYAVGGNLNYSFSRKLKGTLDLKYRKKESTFAAENFEEYSALVSMVYGFGSVARPTRGGGF